MVATWRSVCPVQTQVPLTQPVFFICVVDPSFPSDGAVELVFARGTGAGGAAPAPTPAAPLRAAPDALARADSLEHLRPLSTLTDDDNGKSPTFTNVCNRVRSSCFYHVNSFFFVWGKYSCAHDPGWDRSWENVGLRVYKARQLFKITHKCPRPFGSEMLQIPRHRATGPSRRRD